MKSLIERAMDHCRVKPGKPFRLEDHDPRWEGQEDVSKGDRKQFAAEVLAESQAILERDQEVLYAADRHSVLVILQAMDAAGKDGTIRHVMSGVNPQGCEVSSFKVPSEEELDHNFLWRYSKRLPERGKIGIFNRSYYEEVLVVRVHTELVARQRIPDVTVNQDFWKDRYDDINAFERHLSRNGTRIVKFFLNVSREEQKSRLLDRVNDPKKHWKFNLADVVERGYWDQYMEAYEEAIAATSTKEAPWYVIPADAKWASRALVASILARTIEGLDSQLPALTEAQRQAIDEGRRLLEAE
jgi:PPK2 family polyphosphate:nucleotide phosphotransferase